MNIVLEIILKGLLFIVPVILVISLIVYIWMWFKNTPLGSIVGDVFSGAETALAKVIDFINPSGKNDGKDGKQSTNSKIAGSLLEGVLAIAIFGAAIYKFPFGKAFRAIKGKSLSGEDIVKAARKVEESVDKKLSKYSEEERSLIKRKVFSKQMSKDIEKMIKESKLEEEERKKFIKEVSDHLKENQRSLDNDARENSEVNEENVEEGTDEIMNELEAEPPLIE